MQLPLPRGLDAGAALERVDPAKDADGLHPVNLGRLVLGEPGPLPCTPRGIVELCRRYGVELNGARVTVVGRGVTVGRPLGLLLTRRSENATVTLCHTGTRDLAAEVRRADVVVAAAGVPGLITADMVQPGATVLDVGVTRTERGLVGDVAPEVAEVAGLLAPMPGGVGPMTRAMLLTNVVEAAERADEPGRRRADTWPGLRSVAGSGHAPAALVLVIAAVGMVRVLTQHWREGAVLLGGALLVAAVLRMVLPTERAGLLAIRSRAIDVLCYSGFGLAMVVLARDHHPRLPHRRLIPASGRLVGQDRRHDRRGPLGPDRRHPGRRVLRPDGAPTPPRSARSSARWPPTRSPSTGAAPACSTPTSPSATTRGPTSAPAGCGSRATCTRRTSAPTWTATAC